MKNANGNQIRLAFAKALSTMYQQEVPLYSKLLSLVNAINLAHLGGDSISHPHQERHGAIRLGKASELFNMRRLFALMNMYPVAYYDLSTAGLPVHSTAFRAINTSDLDINPFRIFTSLLRLEFIPDKSLRQEATAVLNKRALFNSELLTLIDLAETSDSFDEQQMQRLIELTLDIFKWHDTAAIELKLYKALKSSHPLIADIVSFKGPHINHLTPSTLDIDGVQQVMIDSGIKMKPHIEGPPKRICPILLRQTSFTAIPEKISFKNKQGSIEQGLHTARFGEIEQRGIALTPKGQQLYEQLIQKVNKQSPCYNDELEHVFRVFPDDYLTLISEQLAYFSYHINRPNLNKMADLSTLKNKDINALIECGAVGFNPIIYEDFLPVSAAGIFNSNLDKTDQETHQPQGNKALFEKYMGCSIIDPFQLYKEQEKNSIEHCLNYFLKFS